jgi:peptide/nickel transport system permease protein
VLVFIGRRLLQVLPILLGVSLVVFVLVHMVPGNVIDLMVPPEAPPDLVAQIKAELGFDRPLYMQYLIWLFHALQGNFGVSAFSGQPVAAELLTALGNTILLAAPAALLGFALGSVLGLIAGWNGGRWQDKLCSAVAITGVSLPHYWVAMILVMVFSVFLNVLPAQGIGDAGLPVTWDQAQYLVLPVVAMSLIPMGVVERIVRASVLDVTGKEFMEALTARGLRDRRVLLHVVKNAAPPALAAMGLQFGYLVGGSILIETVFNWPGCGRLLNLAIFRRDIPEVQACILVLAFLFVMLNLAVDIGQAIIDPRIRR